MVFSIRYLFQIDPSHEAIPPTFDQNSIAHISMVDSTDSGSTKHNRLAFGYFLRCDFSLLTPFVIHFSHQAALKLIWRAFLNHSNSFFSFINSILLIAFAIIVEFEINAKIQMMLCCFDSDQFIGFSMRFSTNRKNALVSTCFKSTSIAEFGMNVLIVGPANVVFDCVWCGPSDMHRNSKW